jgi:hypothetical protein
MLKIHRLPVKPLPITRTQVVQYHKTTTYFLQRAELKIINDYYQLFIHKNGFGYWHFQNG